MTKDVKKFLKNNADEKYLEFSNALGVGNSETKRLGVRIPIMKGFAKELSKQYDLKFLLDNIDEEYHDELMLKLILIGFYKNLEWCELEEYLKEYVPKIFDWSLCDTLCSGLKITKKYYSEMWILVNEYLKSSDEFEVRFALVMLLNYFLTDEYMDDVFDIILHVSLDKYYVKIANAWLISYCTIKYPERTVKFLKKNMSNIDEWTFRKGIQKSIESFRVTDEVKDKLKALRN